MMVMEAYNNGEQEQQPNLPLSFTLESLNTMTFTATGSMLAGSKVVRSGAAVVEKRQRRKIKNRESAARSRARKLAYNIQQQVDIKELQTENEFLRKAIKALSTKLAPKMTGDGIQSLKRSISGPL